MAILGKNGGGVFIHCETASACVVIPGRVDIRVPRVGPVLGDGVVFNKNTPNGGKEGMDLTLYCTRDMAA